jgi:Arc/MetJ-type ribon-helix-helix transcriptional regulator
MVGEVRQGKCVTCRVPASLATKLDELTHLTGKSRSDVVRWLIRKARREDFPRTWLDAAAEERALLARQEGN